MIRNFTQNDLDAVMKIWLKPKGVDGETGENEYLMMWKRD